MASKKSKNTGIVITLLVISIAGGAALGAYVVETPAALHVPTSERKVKVLAKEPSQGPMKLVPHVEKDGTVSFDRQSITIPHGQDPRVYLVNEYLKTLHAQGLGDKDARALGIYISSDGIAHLDFNQAFDESYGSMDEGTVLNGIEATLGQFPEIDQIQFEIDNKPMQTTGNIDLSQPVPVIRPGEPITQTSADAA